MTIHEDLQSCSTSVLTNLLLRAKTNVDQWCPFQPDKSGSIPTVLSFLRYTCFLLSLVRCLGICLGLQYARPSSSWSFASHAIQSPRSTMRLVDFVLILSLLPSSLYQLQIYRSLQCRSSDQRIKRKERGRLRFLVALF